MHISLFGMAFLFVVSNSLSQAKQLKRPKSKVGVYSIDNFVTQSFDLYDKIYNMMVMQQPLHRLKMTTLMF